MRKLLLPAVVVAAAFLACESKTPVGPGSVTITQTTTSSTTTSTIPTTTTTVGTTTTTTSVPTGAARRYVAFQPPPNVPADLTLFFELLGPQGLVESIVEGLPLIGPSITENEYRVTGVYIMGNGTKGDVRGELGGTLNPLEEGGEFEGTMTANMPSGCVAERVYEGRLTSQTLDWDGGRTLRNCEGNPLFFDGLTMLRSDSAQLPTTTSTVSSTTTTTSAPTSTTTTTVACNFTLNQSSAHFTAAGGTGQAVVGTTAGCAWTAQSFASWITNVTPANGSGPGAVQFTVGRNTGTSRSGTLVIAGLTFNVTQEDAADLIPATPTSESCIFVSDNPAVAIQVSNPGPGSAPASTAVATFAAGSPAQVAIPAMGAGGQTVIQFLVPDACFETSGSCAFTIAVDSADVVAETNESNNTTKGTCAFFEGPAARGGV